jgi:hypothetical protein
MRHRDGTLTVAVGKQPKRSVDGLLDGLGRRGAGVEFERADGEEGGVGCVACVCGVEGGEDGAEFGWGAWGEGESAVDGSYFVVWSAVCSLVRQPVFHYSPAKIKKVNESNKKKKAYGA